MIMTYAQADSVMSRLPASFLFCRWLDIGAVYVGVDISGVVCLYLPYPTWTC